MALDVRNLLYDNRAVAINTAVGQTRNKIRQTTDGLRSIENVDIEATREFIGQRIGRAGSPK